MVSRRAIWIGAAETAAALAVVAWVGGHAALGAFAARILFRDLPRPLAAETMTTIFRSFDGLIAVALVVLSASALVRVLAATRLGGPDRAALLAAALLVALGIFELGFVHPRIEALFHAGRTLEPAFASLHRLSERCGHLEVALTAVLFASWAWTRACEQ